MVTFQSITSWRYCKIKFIVYLVFAISCSLVINGCSSISLLNATIPHNGYTLHKDIAYGDHSRQRLDIYVPNKLEVSAPVIVFFYGGSWQSGSKSDYRFVGEAFATRGYITVIADYRLYPEVYFPNFVQDGAKAFAWTHSHIAEYGGDANRLFMAGHSAGAYIAVMLSLNDSYLKMADAKRSWIKGTIGIAGPYDFLPFTSPNIKAIFSKEEEQTTQPITYVTTHVPPMLLITGDEDNDVFPRNTQKLAEKLRKYRNPVIEKIYPGIAHMGIMLALADGFRSKAPVLEDIDHFIHNVNACPQKTASIQGVCP